MSEVLHSTPCVLENTTTIDNNNNRYNNNRYNINRYNNNRYNNNSTKGKKPTR